MQTTVKLTPESDGAAVAQAWLAEAAESEEPDTHTRRHRDPRTPWHVPLEIRVRPGERNEETHYATAVDVSRGGIAFRTRKTIPPFTPIRVSRAGEIAGVRAVTLTAVASLADHVIGAEFRSETAECRRRLAKAG